MRLAIPEIESRAPNVATLRDGMRLSECNSFSDLYINSAGTLFWGKCVVGNVPYHCSADYSSAAHPAYCCSCGSKSLPCRHVIGLMFVFVRGLQFDVADVPKSLAEMYLQQAKKEAAAGKPRRETLSISEQAAALANATPNVKAVVKRIDQQLAGVELAKKLLYSIVQTGLSQLDATVKVTVGEQITELGNYYIAGIQAAFNNLMFAVETVANDEYSRVVDCLAGIATLIERAEDYLKRRRAQPEAPLETATPIEEQIGRVWKLHELMLHGLFESNAEIIQLSFNIYNNRALSEYIDEGYWFNLKTGVVYKSLNYRPYRAAGFIAAEKTCPDVLQPPELFIYPGYINPRARWNSAMPRKPAPADLQCIIDAAATDYSALIKSVKTVIKDPLADKTPVAVLRLHHLRLNGEHFVLEDEAGNILTLTDCPARQISVEQKLQALFTARFRNFAAITVMLHNNLATGLFTATALSLISDDKIERLLL
jgi:hypothetical protein